MKIAGKTEKLVEFKSYIRPDQLEWLNREAAKRDDAGQGRGAGKRQRSGLLREVIDAAIIGYGAAEKALKQCKGKEGSYRIVSRARTYHFATLEAAQKCAQSIFDSTGVVVGIERNEVQ